MGKQKRLSDLNQQDDSFTLDDSKPLSANELSYLLYTETKLTGVLCEICREFTEVELLEKYGSYMKLRVPKRRSLGALFGLVEEIKNKYSVSDYSVSQTTLE